MQYLLEFAKYKPNLIITLLIISCIILPVEAIGYSNYTADIIESVNKNNFKVLKPILIVIGIYTFTRIMYFIKYYIEIFIDAEITSFIRKTIFNKIIEKYSKNYAEIEAGKVISYLEQLPYIYESIIYKVLQLFPYMVSIIILTGYFFTVDIKIGIGLITMFLIIAFVLKSQSQKFLSKSLINYKTYQQVNENIQDKVTNILSVIVNNQKDNEKTSNESRENNARAKHVDAHKSIFITDSINGVVITIFVAVILLLYPPLFKGASNKKKVVASFLIFFYLLGYIDASQWDIIRVVETSYLIKIFEDLLSSPEMDEDLAAKKKMIPKNHSGKIKLDHVTFHYDEAKKDPVHSDLNMQFKRGQTSVIVGQSGSGKTTIVNMILGLIKPTTGNLYIDKYNYKDLNMTEVRDHIALVNQDTKLFNSTIMENIQYGNSVTKSVISRYVEKEGLANVLPPLDKKTGVNGSNLSKGQCQLVLILRAYFQHKPIMILDEPTASLDPNTKGMILDIIKAMAGDTEDAKTVIIVTHDQTVMQVADKVYRL